MFEHLRQRRWKKTHKIKKKPTGKFSCSQESSLCRVCVRLCVRWVSGFSGLRFSFFASSWKFQFSIFLYFPKNSTRILQQTLLASTLICCSLSPSRQHHQCWLSWGEQQLEIFNKILISKHDSIFFCFSPKSQNKTRGGEVKILENFLIFSLLSKIKSLRRKVYNLC